MKTWMTITCACCAAVLAFASWLEATTSNYAVTTPALFEQRLSNPEALTKAIKATNESHYALARIRVAKDTTPEQLRAGFTDYWNARVCIETENLSLHDQELIKTSLQKAHLERTRILTAQLTSLAPSLEVQRVSEELARGVKATARF